MYPTGDTIAAISSPPGRAARTIFRLSGSGCCAVIAGLCGTAFADPARGVHRVTMQVAEVPVPAYLYFFAAGRSYTGEDVAELHVAASVPVAGEILQRIVALGARPAEPGEFTARAYFNGRMDLAQAEAVAELIAAGSRTQLAAAARLLQGRLSQTIASLQREILELLSLIEAALDFAGEQIEFISDCAATARLAAVIGALEELLARGIECRRTLELPCVAIAGLPNAGKSSLLNALLESRRAIVSPLPATTRDVLCGLLQLEDSQCLLLDCAGFSDRPHDPIDELAQAAAEKAVQSADFVIFCLDADAANHEAEQRLIDYLGLRDPIFVAGRSDLLDPAGLAEKYAALARISDNFMFVSIHDRGSIERLKSEINRRLRGRTESHSVSAAAVTERCRLAAAAAAADAAEAIEHIRSGAHEVAAMYLRSAWSALAPIESEHVDEAILNSIFERFCIGK